MAASAPFHSLEQVLQVTLIFSLFLPPLFTARNQRDYFQIVSEMAASNHQETNQSLSESHPQTWFLA